MNELTEYLKNNISLTDAIQEKLNKISVKKEIQKGESILSENSLKKQHIFVLNGCLRSFYRMENGKEFTIQFAIQNWWIGDYITLYTENKSILSIEALTKSEILLIDKIGLEQLFLEHHEIATFQRKNFEKRIAALQKRILSLLTLTALENNYQIASFLGITPESLSRIRKERNKN